MKIVNSFILISMLPSSLGFAPPSVRTRAFQQQLQMVATAEDESKTEADTKDDKMYFASSMPSAEETPYAKLGVKEDQLALGVDPDDFLKWIGTREEIIEKFESDNESFTLERATEEVDRFLMDAEMINAWITYEKRKAANPDAFKVAELEEAPSTAKTIATYAAWLVGGASFSSIRQNYVEPKYASGEWERPNFGAFFGQSASETSDAVVQTTDAVVQTTVDAVTDAASNSL
mmetsp:Transcript_6963/g.8475  ORF Transcript_6963/g.8475 Transcript_6963/m.8475 type:complete len:233 (+) Transcript_6963:118-816(+)